MSPSATSVLTVTATPTGTVTPTATALPEGEFRIFPNPLTGGRGSVSYFLAAGADEITVLVFGIDYRRVAKITGFPTHPGVTHIVPIDLSRLAAGPYIAVPEVRQGSVTKRWSRIAIVVESGR